MRLFAVHEHHGALDFTRIGKNRHVDEGERRGRVPAAVRIERALVVAARRLVVVPIIDDELRRRRPRIRESARERVAACLVVGGALRIEGLLEFVAAAFIRLVEVAARIDAAHVVHGRGNGRLDARIHRCRVDGHAAPAADAENADALGIDVFACREIVNRRAEVLGIDVGRSHVAGAAAALARKGRIEGNREEAAFRKRLRVKPGRLLLHGAERSTHGNRGVLAANGRRCLGLIKVCGKRDAVAVHENDLFVRDLVALRKNLVPLRFENKLFGRDGARFDRRSRCCANG